MSQDKAVGGAGNVRGNIDSGSGLQGAWRRVPLALALVVGVQLLACAVPARAAGADDYAQLVALFEQWRAFEAPRLVDGVPDYSPDAMTRQRKALPAY